MLTKLRGFAPLVLVAAAALSGCGGQSVEGPGPPVAGAAKAPRGAKPAARPSRLRRSDMMPVLSAGLQRFLPLVEIKPSFANGRFYGWRIAALHWEGTPLAGVDDVQPGDVVTAVNGRPIERPEQMFACWQSLTMASELRISYDRGQEKRQILYPIDDDPPSTK
jgi:S1-C subfamily serine protease